MVHLVLLVAVLLMFAPMVAFVVGSFLGLVYFMEKYTRYKGTFKILHLFEPYGFIEREIPNLTGKTFIVTGANSGLGFGTTKMLAQNGADVIMAVKSVQRGEDAKRLIGNTKGKLTIMELDTSSLASTRRFSDQVKALNLPLHGAIFNAGIMAPPFELTADGIESQFQVNYLSHAALAKELVPFFDSTQTTTMVFVTSVGMFFSVADGVYTDLAKINNAKEYKAMAWYGQSKLAVMLFARELSDHLGPESSILCNSIHPGGVQGKLTRQFVGANQLLQYFDWFVQKLLYWKEEEGALTTVGAAVSRKLIEQHVTGKYFVPVLREETEGNTLADESVNLRKQLWAFTEKLLEEKGWATDSSAPLSVKTS